MIKNTLLLAFTVISSTACANIAGNEIAPTYNLKSNTRGLFIDPVTSDSMEQVNMLLYKQWYFTKVLTLDGKPDMDVNSCKTLLKASNENYKTTNYQAKSILKDFKKTCSTWRDMGKLKPSKESFLSSFKPPCAPCAAGAGGGGGTAGGGEARGGRGTVERGPATDLWQGFGKCGRQPTWMIRLVENCKRQSASMAVRQRGDCWKFTSSPC